MLSSSVKVKKSNRIKFIVGGLLFIAAVGILVISATQKTVAFFMTVREVQESGEDLIGQSLRVSGAVIGETIDYDAEEGLLYFSIAHIPGDDKDIVASGGLESVLHQAVIDTDAPRLPVIYEGVPPDMLKDEAQAVLTGTLRSNGVFWVEELLLKCPSKYEDALPDQVQE